MRLANILSVSLISTRYGMQTRLAVYSNQGNYDGRYHFLDSVLRSFNAHSSQAVHKRPSARSPAPNPSLASSPGRQDHSGGYGHRDDRPKQHVAGDREGHVRLVDAGW